jgi:hypothetical protein
LDDNGGGRSTTAEWSERRPGIDPLKRRSVIFRVEIKPLEHSIPYNPSQKSLLRQLFSKIME